MLDEFRPSLRFTKKLLLAEEEPEETQEVAEMVATKPETTDPAPSYQDDPYTQTVPIHSTDQQQTMTNGLEPQTEVIDDDLKPSSPPTIEPDEPDVMRRTPTPTAIPPVSVDKPTNNGATPFF